MLPYFAHVALEVEPGSVFCYFFDSVIELWRAGELLEAANAGREELALLLKQHQIEQEDSPKSLSLTNGRLHRPLRSRLRCHCHPRHFRVRPFRLSRQLRLGRPFAEIVFFGAVE